MPLPDLIGIEPLPGPVDASILLPGSKSITNRALILAAQAAGETELRGALWSEDTQVMVDCLRELGFIINVGADPGESSNRTITIYGKGGEIPPGGSEASPLELFIGNAGTAARFLTALVCLGRGYYRLHGVPRMHARPQSGLFAALRELGYEVRADNDKLPAVVRGAGPRTARCRVNIQESSQFASALLLCARTGGWSVEIAGEDEEEMPYVRMTQQLIHSFGTGICRIEPDASGGSYFVGADELQRKAFPGCRARIALQDWPFSGWQIDEQFPRYAAGMASTRAPIFISRASDLGDSIMTAIVLAPFWERESCFVDLGRLRLQECERVAALRTELGKCGARVVEVADTLQIQPGRLHGAEIETYQDHRMAMCFAMLALRVPQMTLRNPACVSKTFPTYFKKLAEPPPHGLGARIYDARTNRVLDAGELTTDSNL